MGLLERAERLGRTDGQDHRVRADRPDSPERQGLAESRAHPAATDNLEMLVSIAINLRTISDSALSHDSLINTNVKNHFRA